uniref:Uncharacterized protein n=1 Tax=Candidatus Kentrum sp. MB TaxID=2138164 RepID=A0A450XLK3_9GAMM|nr:MAG: hypothetical protein BECKMB1821I_GA0114274_10142 [Candidatus Kentron sp. MB]VFK75121.1 MAG: hypothetical protein BECKMB1821H_GA0114242_10162 [Candidatus Kentron sp. MB]
MAWISFSSILATFPGIRASFFTALESLSESRENLRLLSGPSGGFEKLSRDPARPSRDPGKPAEDPVWVFHDPGDLADPSGMAFSASRQFSGISVNPVWHPGRLSDLPLKVARDRANPPEGPRRVSALSIDLWHCDWIVVLLILPHLERLGAIGKIGLDCG